MVKKLALLLLCAALPAGARTVTLAWDIPAQPVVTYLQFSTDLVHWSDLILVDEFSGGVTVQVPSEKGFFRFRCPF